MRRQYPRQSMAVTQRNTRLLLQGLQILLQQPLGLIEEKDSPHLGPIRQPVPMWNFSESAVVSTDSMGVTGAHTREVLAELGLSEDEIDELIAAEVAYTAEA